MSAIVARMRHFGAALLLFAVLWAGPASAQQPGQRLTEEQLGELVMGSMMFILFHELGHSYIDQLALPTVGPEEDVADEFAIFILAEVAKAGEEFGARALLAAAESWRLMWLEVEPMIREQPDQFPFWDEHNLDIKRFYNIVCLLYGSDPATFWPLLSNTGVPVERGRRCEDEYKQKWTAWQKLMEPHVVPEGQTPPADRRRFKVSYGNADTEVARQLSEVFQQERVWEKFLEPLADNILMPNDIDVFVRSCGTVNAWWDSETGSVTICYDLIEFLSVLFIKANFEAQQAGNQPAPPQPPPGGGQPGGGQPGGGQPGGAAPGGVVPEATQGDTVPGTMQGGTVPVGPAPPGPPPFAPQPGQAPLPPVISPSPAPMPIIDQRIVGVWQAQSNAMGGASVTRLSLNQDGSFMQMSYGPTTAPFYVWGTYVVERNRIRFTTTGWQPQQICNAQGCSPVRMPQQEYAQFQLMGPTTMQLRQSMFYRIQ